MAYSLKKVLTAMAVSLVAATSIVSASIVDGGYIYDGSYGPGPGNGCCPPTCNPCGPAYSCGPCGDFFFSAEALIFRACEDGLAYGTHTETILSTTATTVPNEVDSRVKNLHPNWNVGFRLGVGYVLPCDCWGIAVNWTHFDSHTHHTFEESFVTPTTGLTGGSFLTPAFGRTDFNVSDDTGIDETEARWKLHLDLVDVELGRPVCISQCLTLRPHIGIRAAWVKQSFDIEYDTISTDAISSLLSEVDLKCDYEGVGLRGGLDTIWDLGCGMSLYGSAAASVLWGHFNVKSETFYNDPENLGAFFDVEQKDDFCGCRAVTDAAIGLRWRSCFCGDSVALTVNVGWEHHLFFNQNQFEDFVVLDDDSTFEADIGEIKNPQFHRGDLCLSGVVIGARIDF